MLAPRKNNDNNEMHQALVRMKPADYHGWG